MQGRIPTKMTVMPEILQSEGENKRELSVCLGNQLFHGKTVANTNRSKQPQISKHLEKQTS